MQSSKKNIKFSIDGDIETPTESSYLKELDKVKSKRFKRLSTMLTLAVIACFIIMSLQFVRIKQTKTRAENAPSSATQATFQNSFDSLMHKNDSLRLVLTRLQVSNDLLTENYSADEGIFFEVHMDFSGDFDLAKYKTELSTLLSNEYDERDKLVLGRFKSFRKALLFENDLKKMGLKNLYLLGRVDGKIMTLKEALAIAQNQNK